MLDSKKILAARQERLTRLMYPLTPADVAVFIPRWNMPDRNDVRGAFEPGAKAFQDYYNLGHDHYVINNKQPIDARAIDLLRCLDKKVSYHEVKKTVKTPQGGKEDIYLKQTQFPHTFVFFCHGWVSGIQFGIRSPTPGKKFTRRDEVHWHEFLHILARSDKPTVILYACSTGDDPEDDSDSSPGAGDNSFGDLLRDGLFSLGASDCRVVTHFTAGHSFLNPDIKIIDGASPSHEGAQPLYKNRKERNILKKLLDDVKTGFVWEFPFMSRSAIEQKLGRSI